MIKDLKRIRMFQIYFVLISVRVFGNSSGEINLNFGWRFAKGEQVGAYSKNFDDSGWRIVNVPHDWSIEDIDGKANPYDEKAPGHWDVGYATGGKAWYRKTFELDSSAEGQIAHLQFDGVYMNADVWINNFHAGSRAYGYSTFWFDITPYVKFGENNTIAIEVKNLGMNSRWYSGSGIFRPVRLRLMDQVHISHWGPAVRTSKSSASFSEVEILTNIVNSVDKDVSASLVSTIKNERGVKTVSIKSDLMIKAGETFSLSDSLGFRNPELWSPESPSLYRLLQEVKVGGKIVDRRETSFGIRTMTFSASKGFLLNGKPVLLQGACMHHDNYMLGSAAHARAEERRVELTKAAGYNAIRCAHNPPSQAFLDACDRIGVLVIVEAFDQWSLNKWNHDQDYGRHFQEWWRKDIEDMVLRDRNHPSIIMWSIGNEIPEQGSEYGCRLAGQLKAHVKQFDPTRPVTAGVNNSGPSMDKFFAEMDIVGYNYRIHTYESDQERVSDRVSYGSETYSRDSFAYWRKVETLPYIIGDFVWTGWDYLGEASIGWRGYAKDWARLGDYPWHAAYCGEIDLTGYKRPAAYYRDVLWKTGKNKVSAFVKSPELSLQVPPDSTGYLDWTYADIHPSWTWPGHEGKVIDVVVYSACEEVELWLNGRSLGRKATSVKTEYKEEWKVSYEPGVLKAIGYKNGKKEAEWILKTAGRPSKIRLVADRTTIHADGSDLSYVTAELFDRDGNRVYDWHEDLPVRFEIEGEGKLAGIGNANPATVESYQKPQRTTFRGRCVAVIQSTFQPGTLILKASANGLKGDVVKISLLAGKRDP